MRLTTRQKKNLLGSSFSGALSSSFVDGETGRGKSRRQQVVRKISLSVEVFWSLWLSERLKRLSSGPPGGRPHARLKAGTLREAPTPAPTTKTLVPTTVNRRSTRAEATTTKTLVPTTVNRRSTRAKATRRAPTFKIMAKRVV